MKFVSKLLKSFLAFAGMWSLIIPSSRIHSQDLASQPEQIEWTWEVRPEHPVPGLPNVLLVGDSITRNYYPHVQHDLADLANVYLFASSACIGDPRLLHQLAEFTLMESVKYRVIHFNNGMHGWTYSEDQYKTGFPAYIAAIRSISPTASLVWASTTPVKSDQSPGPTNARVDARNRIARGVMRESRVDIDDQHELMLSNTKYFQDNVHFNEEGAALQGKQTARYVRDLLKARQ